MTHWVGRVPYLIDIRMTEIGNIEKKKEVDKRTALLALAAAKSEATRHQCLSSEEMAKLLEGKCDTSSRQELLTHLAHCPKCYEEWSVLRAQLLVDKESGQHKKRGKLLQFITRPKNMAIFGSALTAAASVLFVLNTQMHKQPVLYHEELIVTQEPAGAVNEREQFSTASDATMEPEQVVQQPAPFVKSSQPEPVPRREDMQELAEKSRVEGRQKEQSLGMIQQVDKQKVSSRSSVREKQKRVVRAEIKESNAPKKEPELLVESLSFQDREAFDSHTRSEEAAAPRVAVKRAAPSKRKTLTIPGWLEQIETACSKVQYDEQLWKRLLASGKTLEQQYQDKQVSDELFLKVLDRVKRIDEQEVGKRCFEIREITSKN